MPWDKNESRSFEVRQKIDHPVIDGDGHTQEYHPEVIEYFREVAGPELTDRYVNQRLNRAWHSSTHDGASKTVRVCPRHLLRRESD